MKTRSPNASVTFLKCNKDTLYNYLRYINSKYRTGFDENLTGGNRWQALYDSFPMDFLSSKTELRSLEIGNGTNKDTIYECVNYINWKYRTVLRLL